MSDSIEIPFTLTFFREARDLGKKWGQHRFDQTMHRRPADRIFDPTWVEPNARLLLGLEPEECDTSHVRGWIMGLSTVIARSAAREYKKLEAEVNR